jgi:hypothetical protein
MMNAEIAARWPLDYYGFKTNKGRVAFAIRPPFA